MVVHGGCDGGCGGGGLVGDWPVSCWINSTVKKLSSDVCVPVVFYLVICSSW